MAYAGHASAGSIQRKSTLKFTEVWGEMMTRSQELADAARDNVDAATDDAKGIVLICLDKVEAAVQDLRTFYISGGE